MIGRIGVCSWSLQATSEQELADRVVASGVSAVQLALDPLRTGSLDQSRLLAAFADRGVRIISGMMGTLDEDYSTLESIRRTGGVVPDRTWIRNLAAARENSALACALGIRLVTMHAGFIPHDPRDPRRPVLLERLGMLADVFDEQGVQLGLETGQESAGTLQALLADLPQVGVNFDPANMILYDMDEPLAALEQLLPHVVQVHVKDAIRTSVPGEWGAEVPAGSGDVPWAPFLALLRDAERSIDLVIEREAGAARVADVQCAVRLLEAHGLR